MSCRIACNSRSKKNEKAIIAMALQELFVDEDGITTIAEQIEQAQHEEFIQNLPKFAMEGEIIYTPEMYEAYKNMSAVDKAKAVAALEGKISEAQKLLDKWLKATYGAAVETKVVVMETSHGDGRTTYNEVMIPVNRGANTLGKYSLFWELNARLMSAETALEAFRAYAFNEGGWALSDEEWSEREFKNLSAHIFEVLEPYFVGIHESYEYCDGSRYVGYLPTGEEVGYATWETW